MELCYLDESGTPELSGNSSHYVLAGLSIPDAAWTERHREFERLKDSYGLRDAEIHTGWMLRPYVEQHSIPEFELMDRTQRHREVSVIRSARLSQLKRVSAKNHREAKRNFEKTAAYIHLSHAERRQAVHDVARLFGSWGQTRIFAECIDKSSFVSNPKGNNIQESAFEQIVSHFERYLQDSNTGYGILIHDNNPTVARRHTDLMRRFLDSGTVWTNIERVIETPMFVDSQLTSMVQLADLVAYALRRYLENGEEELFDLVFQRADRIGSATVGIRHFTTLNCPCKICASHSA